MTDTTREPVLWVLDFDGHPLHPDFVFASAEEAENYKRHTISHCQIVPLFRHPPQPTLTDAERKLLQKLEKSGALDGFMLSDTNRQTLRALLARLGGAS